MIIELIPKNDGPFPVIHVKHDGEIMGRIRLIDECYFYDDDRYGRLKLGNISMKETELAITEFITEQAKTINPYKDDEDDEDEEDEE